MRNSQAKTPIFSANKRKSSHAYVWGMSIRRNISLIRESRVWGEKGEKLPSNGFKQKNPNPPLLYQDKRLSCNSSSQSGPGKQKATLLKIRVAGEESSSEERCDRKGKGSRGTE